LVVNKTVARVLRFPLKGKISGEKISWAEADAGLEHVVSFEQKIVLNLDIAEVA
jgi:hypothetical protein